MGCMPYRVCFYRQASGEKPSQATSGFFFLSCFSSSAYSSRSIFLVVLVPRRWQARRSGPTKCATEADERRVDASSQKSFRVCQVDGIS